MNAISGAAQPQPAEIVVGFVNNSRATAATDLQFLSLLHAASPGQPIRLRRFAPTTDIPGYEPIDALWHQRLDGIIVTGAEPQADAIADEPSWPFLARLVDWAAEHTQAAIWSCLSAHTAVFRLDGLPRRRRRQKLSGVFECRRAAYHILLEDAPAAWPVPHSRCNDLDADALERLGYTILARGPGRASHDGADSFTKTVGRSTFLMLQGHPEYMADTLLREYRRDLRRCLAGAARPLPPTGYLDPDLEQSLRCAADPAACLDAIHGIAMPNPVWHAHSVRLYQNWLAGLHVRAAAETALSTP